MITPSEWVWLNNRKRQSPFDFFSCSHCKANSDPLVCWTIKRCPACIDFKDALEFSERVAAKLAKHIHNKPLVCETNWDCPYWPQGTCAWCYLKAARLEVEEEMECTA